MPKDQIHGEYSAPDEQERHRSYIRVAAEEVTNNFDGTFTIAVRARKLTTDEIKFISELFPNFSEQAHAILHKEALFAAIVD